MRTSILGLAAIAALVTASATFGQTSEEVEVKQLREGVQHMGEHIADQPALVQDWLLHSEIIKQLTKENLKQLLTELESKSITDLYLIKLSQDNRTCQLTNCYGLIPSEVRNLADAVAIGRDKEQSARNTTINATISISGAILAVLSFVMSASSTVITLRSKKSSNA
jgi:hypothetical protein